MAISFVAVDSQYTNAGTTVTVNVPSGAAAGDLLIAVFHSVQGRSTSAGGPFAPGSGVWHRIQLRAGGSTSVNIYWRIMQGGDTSWTFTVASSSAIRGVVVAYTDSSPKWCVTTAQGTDDTNATTASTSAQISDGIAVMIGTAYRATAMTGISIDIGTSRIASLTTQMAMAISDNTSGGTFISTTTGSTPSDHLAFVLTVQSSPTGELDDPAELIDGSREPDVHIYKGRDTAVLDTAGAA